MTTVYLLSVNSYFSRPFFHLKPKQQNFYIEVLGYFFMLYAINYFRKHSKDQIRRDASMALFGYRTWDHMQYSGKERGKYSTSDNNGILLCTLNPLTCGKARWGELQVESLMQESKVGNSWKVGRIAQIWRQSVQINRTETILPGIQ